MAITVIVRAAGQHARLTFDAARVVIGRGAGSDVRLPDASVSHRHASLRAQGAEFVIVDEGSTNGTFVGGVRVAPHTSRIVRSGDVARIGRIVLELWIDRSAVVTRDAGAATRELALALVARAMAVADEDLAARVRVVEGRDQGLLLSLSEEGRGYLIGRAPHCDLTLTDAGASREHICVVRRGGAVFARDLGTKNATWVGDARVADGVDVSWRPATMIKVGHTVLALEEPIAEALAAIEDAPDEPIPADLDPVRSAGADTAED
ncbi:MAG: FHA domain-containing protein, partial [Polyangiaceae bacterium]